MFHKLTMAVAATIMMAGAAYADPIEGNWKTTAGATAAIASCGGSFCVTLTSGKHSGKKIGTLKANGANAYSGKITDPADDKTYSGKATLSGNALKMGGCVFGGLICRNENWSRL